MQIDLNFITAYEMAKYSDTKYVMFELKKKYYFVYQAIIIKTEMKKLIAYMCFKIKQHNKWFLKLCKDDI